MLFGRTSRRRAARSGAFPSGEDSVRADGLTALWQARWPRSEPIGHRLRVAYPDRWVRFHSLPDGKRYADSETERREVADRHQTVLDGLHTTGSLVVIAEDRDHRDLHGGWSRHVAGRWPWRISTDFPSWDSEDGTPAYFWASSVDGPTELRALLADAADDEADFIVGAADLRWVYAPYEGGADVLLPSSVERDVLARRHEDWLPQGAHGL